MADIAPPLARLAPRLRALRHALIILLVASLDLALIQAVLSGDLSAERAVAMHSLVVLTFGLLSILILRRAALSDLSCLLLLLLFGPAGGVTMLAGLVTAQILPALRSGGTDLRRNLSSQQTASVLLEGIRQNRRRKGLQAGMVPMTWTMAFGSDLERSALLGVIARRFTPGMRPALDMALRSPDAALRVQAASVHAKLRDGFADRAAGLVAAHQQAMAQGADTARIAELRTEIHEVLGSGFLEDGAQARLAAALAGSETPPPADPDRTSDPARASMAMAVA